jgi:hypothetical protein
LVCWRGLRTDEQDRRRIAMKLKLVSPGAVADLAINWFDGLDTFEDLASDGRRVQDYWF